MSEIDSFCLCCLTIVSVTIKTRLRVHTRRLACSYQFAAFTLSCIKK